MVLTGYGYSDITEMTWGIGEGGQQVDPDRNRAPRLDAAVDTDTKYAFAATRAEAERRRREDGSVRHQPFFGLTLVSCERGDMRQSPDGLYVYTNEGREERTLEGRGHGRGALGELRDALDEDRPTFPNHRWGMASLEVALAILQSSRERRDVPLSLQVPVPF